MRKLLWSLVLLLPAVSQAWWSDDWNFRKSVSDLPVLIRLHAGNFGYFADAKPDGSDLRVVAGDDKTPLQFHIERWDATSQLAFVWVRLPQLAAGAKDTKIFLYYGNQKSGAGASAGSTYDANQALVLHFGETQGLPKDSTANGNNPTVSTAQLNPAALIAGGLKLDAGNTLVVPASSSLRLVPARGLSFSAWVRVAGPQSDAYVMALEGEGNAVVLGLNLYVDVVAAGNAAITPAEIGGTLTIGGSVAGGHNLVGDLDEVQVANVPRAGALIQAAARSQGVDAPLVVYGADAQKESGGVSYFSTTMKNGSPSPEAQRSCKRRR